MFQFTHLLFIECEDVSVTSILQLYIIFLTVYNADSLKFTPGHLNCSIIVICVHGCAMQ